MGSRLDKNSKLPSGNSKESSSAGKSKAKSSPAKAQQGAEAKSAKAAKPADATRKAKAASETPSSNAKESAGGRPSDKSSKVSEKAPARARSSAKASAAPSSKAAPIARRASATASRTEKGRAAGSAASAEGLGLEEFSIALIKPGETKERIWRTKSFHQMQVQREFGFPDVAPQLPGQYHQDKLVLMPKDPEYMFCYWELTPNLIDDKAKEKVPDGNYRETLKINWESRSLFEPNFTFIPVFFWARKWYFGVPQVGQRYQVELGWLSDTGHFISIIRSNLSELPESWAVTQKRLSEQGDVLAYTARTAKSLGSSEHLAVEDNRAFIPEWNLSSESFSSSSWSRGPGDAGAATAAKETVAPGATAPVPKAASKKPAVPKARLEISGKVLPGTKVVVGGKPVPIDGQGFFKTEFPYEQDTLSLQLTDREGASRSFAYDLKELVLT